MDETASGTWSLTITDRYNDPKKDDSGSLQSWKVIVHGR